jgi:hypothetical protein
MEEIINSAKKVIPNVDSIIEETWLKLGIKNKAIVRKKFGVLLVAFDEEATNIFRSYERQVLLALAKAWLETQKDYIRKKLELIISKKGWDDFIEEASKLFSEFGGLVQTVEKDLGNMRKARGGKSFEKVILKFLNFLSVNGEIPKGVEREKLGRIDIIIPSTKIAISTPDRAIFLTCKRTLRERWKQEVPQARPNQRIYLLTIDEDISKNKAQEINEKGLIAFVRDELKQKSPLNEMTWIRRLSDLPKELNKI